MTYSKQRLREITALKREAVGKLENGCFADLVILNSNPLDDIAHASDIDAVIKNGVAYPADSILH